MSVSENIKTILSENDSYSFKLVAVSKTKPIDLIKEAYESGQRLFGENKVQELTDKYQELPKDIEWHMIGHLQSNKVKYIAPFVSLIHAIDSIKLLKEVNKQASKNNRVINCLLQLHIATEETKFGFSFEEVRNLIASDDFLDLKHIKVIGLMGMATNTTNTDQVHQEFKSLKSFFDELAQLPSSDNLEMSELSMGMSNDYFIALQEGSTVIRVGSSIFGARNYQ